VGDPSERVPRETGKDQKEAKVDLLKKTKEMRYGAERVIVKIEENVAKSRDLAPESKSRLRLEIDSLKGDVRRCFSELETRTLKPCNSGSKARCKPGPLLNIYDTCMAGKCRFCRLTEIKLIYLVLFWDIALVLGLILWLLSRQWLIVPEKITWYECPFCKKRWRLSATKL